MTFNKVGFVSIFLMGSFVLLISGCSDEPVNNQQTSHTHGDGTVHLDESHPEPAAKTEANHDHSAPTPAPAPAHDENALVVHLDATGSANLNLKTLPIQHETWFDQIKIPGTVSVDPDRLVHVSLPATVRVLQLNAPLHSTVAAGQQLAVLEFVDPVLNQMQIRAVELRAELLGYQIKIDRARTYMAALPIDSVEGKSQEYHRVEADLAVTEAESLSLRSSLNAILETLKISGLSEAQLKTLAEDGIVTTRITIVAPHLPGSPDLEVAVRPVDLGETVPAGTTLFELVAMDQLLVIGDAFESDLPVVYQAARENLPVSLVFPAQDKRVGNLQILTVESALDGEERITHFLVPVPNKLFSEKVVSGIKYREWELRAGSQVQIMVATQKGGVSFVLPSSAIIRDAGRVCVFKKISDGYQRIDVRLERLDGRNAVLALDHGLHAGDEIVTNGALQLNLILKQEEGGPSDASDHGHAH